MTYLRTFLGPVLLLLTGLATAGAEPGDRSFEQYCLNGSDGQEVCRVSLAALAFDPGEVDGKLVYASGYLVVDDGILTIYSSRHAFVGGDRRQALRVRGPAESQRNLVRKFRAQVITFSGRVDATAAGALRRGYMADIHEVKAGPAVLPADPSGGDVESLGFEGEDLDD